MFHYWFWIPAFFMMKIVSNLVKLKNPLSELENQKKFANMIGVFSKYFWKILFKKPTFYKLG
jgi:hypothetical protein